MPRAKMPMGRRLFAYFIAGGGTLTRSQIRERSGFNVSSAEIDRGLSELKGLFEVSRCRLGRSRRYSQRYTLTLAGWAAAAELKPGFRPLRLTTPELKSAVEALQADRDPWALSLLRDAEDAASWRHHEQRVERHEIVCGPPKPKAHPRGRPFGSPTAKALPVAETFLEPTYHVPGKPDVAPIVVPATRQATCRRCGHCERCHLASDMCPCGPRHVCGRSAPAYSPSNMKIEPTSQGDGEDSVNRAKIEAANYGTAIRGANRIAYGGAIISFAEFVQRMQL